MPDIFNEIFGNLKDEKDIEDRAVSWVNKNIKYKQDKRIKITGKDGVERFKQLDIYQDPTETLKLRTGDCEDKSILTQWLIYKMTGNIIPWMHGKQSKDSEDYHAWLQKKSGEIYDPTFSPRSYTKEQWGEDKYIPAGELLIKQILEGRKK